MLVQRGRHLGRRGLFGRRQQRRSRTGRHQPPLEGRDKPGGGREQGAVIRQRLQIRLAPCARGAGTTAGAAQGVRESRTRPGTQGQNTYLSRASTLRSAPNQQLFWS